MFGRLGRRRRAAPSDLAAIRAAVPRWLPAWSRLSSVERDRLVERTGRFIDEVRWEAANGFAVNDEMRIAIAGHAALLVVGFDDGVDNYREVSSVIVHPSTIMRRGVRSTAVGHMVADGASPLIGEAHHKGPVLVSWSSARFQARHPRTGENVLLHEFAHRLDMLDGVVDGTPVLADEAATHRWVSVCTEAFDRLVRGDEHPVLRPYAATDAGEFFAVATESFFTQPSALREHEPALYEVLADFYRQDPAATEP